MEQIELAAYIAVGLGVVLLSLGWGLIASARYHAARARTRLDLFAKRWRVYASVANAMDGIIAHRALPDGDAREFRRGVAGYEFLFGADVIGFIEEMIGQIGEGVAGGRDADTTDEAARPSARAWCEGHRTALRPLFARYMDLSGH